MVVEEVIDERADEANALLPAGQQQPIMEEDLDDSIEFEQDSDSDEIDSWTVGEEGPVALGSPESSLKENQKYSSIL